ncbi:MAG: hypothetical protein SFZ23_09010 [Planctomycetota bacterium]|nr:hypothetical protein [Planctomycetota bacterium]
MPPGTSQLDAAVAHLRAGRHAQARALLVRLKPDEQVSTAMAMLAASEGQVDQARYHAGRVASTTTRADLLAELAGVMEKLGDVDAMLEYAARALERDENQGLAASLLIALAKRGPGATGLANAWLRAAQAHSAPRFVLPLSTLLLSLGRASEGATLLRRVLDARPSASGPNPRPTFADCMLASALANIMNYVDPPELARTLDEHRRFGALATAAARLSPSIQAPTLNPSGSKLAAVDAAPIRLGVISADLRTHSVAFFASALFEHLDPHAVELHVTSTHPSEDDVTVRFRARARSWRNAGAISDADLARELRRDALHAILDLSGHTSDHALGALACKPAPVILTYCGYPNTTGLDAVDFRIVDSLTDPPLRADRRCVERLLRLDPCFLCYDPARDAPLCRPVALDGPPTFASFNNFAKMNDRVLATWARLLMNVPDSRLILKAGMLADDGSAARVRGVFARAGVRDERLELLPRTASFAEHMAIYSRAHVALDTFPYAGTTTTCEALWMGVPVVTLSGPDGVGGEPETGSENGVLPHASRVGLSLLSAVGLSDLAARDEAAYIAIASALVANRPRLAELRSHLRARMRASPLCDGPGFARRFEALLRSAVEQRRELSGG